MLAIFIMLVIAIALTAGIGFGILSLIQNAQTTLTIQQNQLRLENVAQQIRARITIDGGRVVLPVDPISDTAGENEFLARIPDGVAYSATTTGQEFVYCPVPTIFDSAQSTPTDMRNALTTGGEEVFPVEIVEIGSKTYVTGAGPALAADVADGLRALGVVAYVISPAPNGISDLRCGDVQLTQDGQKLIIPGGSVAEIHDASNDLSVSEFVVHNGALSADEQAALPVGIRQVNSLTDAIGFVERYDVRDVTINLFEDTDIAIESLRTLVDLSFGRTMRLEGPGAGSIKVTVDFGSTTPPGGEEVLLLNGDVNAERVVFEGTGGVDVGIGAGSAGDVRLSDVTAAFLRTVGGRLHVDGASRVRPLSGATASTRPVATLGGNITLDIDDSQGDPFIRANNAVTVLDANGGDIALQSAFHVETNAAARLFSTSGGGDIVTTAGSGDLFVNRGEIAPGNNWPTETYSTLQRVGQDCASGSTICSVSCPAPMLVRVGECRTSSGSSLSGHYSDPTGMSYTCEWGGMVPTSNPRVTAICEYR